MAASSSIVYLDGKCCFALDVNIFFFLKKKEKLMKALGGKFEIGVSREGMF